MRSGGFPAPDEPLDDGGLRKAATHRPVEPVPARLVASPALAARQTASAMGIDAPAEQWLRDIDHGAWSGRSFVDLHASDPQGLAGWIADPARGAPDGETMAAVADRVAAWMEAHASLDTPVLAITHPIVIRAAIAHALDIPLPATLRIDVAPLSTTRLSFNRIWRLQAIQPES